MKTFITINRPYLYATILLLLIEIAIAVFLKSGFIRFTFGDYLATILVYTCIRAFIAFKPIQIAALTLCIAFGIEGLQLFDVLDFFGLKGNRLVATLLGTHFSFGDLVAYTLGVITIYLLDINLKKCFTIATLKPTVTN